MWASAIWGLLTTGIALFLGRLAMIWTTGHEEWGPRLVWAAIFCFLAALVMLVWPLIHKWSQNENNSRRAIRWRRRLVSFMHALPIIGIIVGGGLFVGSIAWVLADSRRTNEDISQTLSRYVLPRHLTDQQIAAVADYLSRFDSQEVKMTVIKNNEEASSYRADIQRALQQGGWTVSTIDYSDDVTEGITTEFMQTIQSSQAREDPKHPRVDRLFTQAFQKAKIPVVGGGTGSGQGITGNTFSIKIGRRRMDDGDLVMKKREQERARRMLEDETE